jgi:hypothetical protein
MKRIIIKHEFLGVLGNLFWFDLSQEDKDYIFQQMKDEFESVYLAMEDKGVAFSVYASPTNLSHIEKTMSMWFFNDVVIGKDIMIIQG